MAQFDQKAKVMTPSKNVFDLSYRSRLSAVMGQLIPVLNKPIVPGDRFRMSIDTLIRLAPLRAPIFDGLKADFHAFFVPNRLLDPDWKEFITGGDSLSVGEESQLPPLRFRLRDYSVKPNENEGMHLSGLFDYLNIHPMTYDVDGQPLKPTTYPDLSLNALPILGYHKIWSDWFRNERIEDGISLGGDSFKSLEFGIENDKRIVTGLRSMAGLGSADYASNLFDKLHYRNYAKDRYTTALPEPVIGGPVILPGSGGVVGSDNGTLTGTVKTSRGQMVYMDSDGKANDGIGDAYKLSSVVGQDKSSLSVSFQLKQAAIATIQDLKTAFKMYSFFMKDTYNGNRYVEFIESHYNVRVPDATIDRSIYLGRVTVPIQFGEVFQTSGTTQTGGADGRAKNALGDYAGRGVGASSGFMFDETFLEHGQLYVIMSIVPRNTYFQGIDKKFLISDRFDYFFPEFQNIGDAAIKNVELFLGMGGSSSEVQNEEVFGYQSRWYDLKQYDDELHGDFLPNSSGIGSNMSFWNFARQFESVPKISKKFSNITPINAPFAVLDEWSDNFYIDIQFNIKALRPIMYYEEF